ncbi:MAG: recombinase, partial [Lachnospiraceae bacterium]|nr:recombinase [Lachnospiraceae bacterium]
MGGISMERTISISMGKGSLAHNNRKFVAENVDRSRVPDNVIYRQEDLKAVYHKLFDNALQEYNSRQKRKDRKIVDYYEKIRQSRQEKLFYEMIVQ